MPHMGLRHRIHSRKSNRTLGWIGQGVICSNLFTFLDHVGAGGIQTQSTVLNLNVHFLFRPAVLLYDPQPLSQFAYRGERYSFTKLIIKSVSQARVC